MKPADSTMEPMSTPMKRVVPPAVSIGAYTNCTNGPTQRCDGGDEDHELTLDAQLVLDGAVDEHDDQGCQGVDGVDLALLGGGHAQTVGRVGKPAGEEGPPDAPRAEEHEDAEGALQVGRILPCRSSCTCHVVVSLFLFVCAAAARHLGCVPMLCYAVIHPAAVPSG